MTQNNDHDIPVSDATATPDLDLARQVLAAEADAVRSLIDRIDGGFAHAAELIFRCAGGAANRAVPGTGTVVTTGIGKAGLVAQKISATLASTGTCSTFLHPVEAVHGDLGRLRKGDCLLAFSQSGETEEIVRLVNVVRKLAVPLISITASADSTLGRHSDAVVTLGQVTEACPLGLAPTASTTAMLALGDALALVVMQMRNFTPAQFAEFHPGGQIGRLLLRVEEAMGFRKGVNLPLFDQDVTVRQTLGGMPSLNGKPEAGGTGRPQPESPAHPVAPATITSLPSGGGPGRGAGAAQNLRSLRRPGAVLLTDSAGRLAGIFTDSDLRRLLHESSDQSGKIGAGGTGNLSALDRPVREVMIANPKRIAAGQLVSAAMSIINQHRIDELPVVDSQDRPIGLIDVQDIVALKLL